VGEHLYSCKCIANFDRLVTNNAEAFYKRLCTLAPQLTGMQYAQNNDFNCSRALSKGGREMFVAQ